MSNLQIIEALCQLVEQQNDLIRMMAAELEMLQSVQSYKDMVRSIQAQYASIIGSNETPDF